ncbi:MAG TPA: amidohydrolase family protein [Terriglobia bacterium]|nr:amidohydrolase family protein [Terriglobia bacterium]
MRRRGCYIFVSLAAMGVLLPVSRLAAQQAPSLILHNGKILTVDNNFSIAQAVAITGQRISAVGSNQQVLATAGPNTQTIDLKGRTVTPGLMDTHRHMYSYVEGAYRGMMTPQELERYPVDWRAVKTKEDVYAQVRGLMARYNFEPGRWVYLTNQVSFMNNNASPIELAKILYDEMNQWDLQKVTPNNPVLMSLGIPDFNGFLLNETAMNWLMSRHGDFVRQNGRFWVDSAGRPDGHLEPPASRIVLPFTYNRKPEVLARLYQKDMEEAAAMGLTSVATRLPQDSLRAYQMLESQGRLTYRIGYGNIEAFGNTDVSGNQLKQYAAQIGKGTEKIWLTGVGPTAIDGASSRQCTNQQRTGTYTPIDSWFPAGQCHTDMEYRGAVRRAAAIQKNYFGDWIMASGRDGVRFANTHVAGDRANANMLNFMERIQQQYGRDATKNWAFDHCGMVDPKDFARMARLGVTVSCYVKLSVNGSANMARAYGEQIANTFPSPLKSMVDAGVKVVLESDSDSYLWEDIEAAVTRKDSQGRVWAPQERVDRPTALRMITRWAADYFLKGDQLGSIEPGKFADLLVLNHDYLAVEPDNISEIQPLVTVFDGRIIFVDPDFAAEYNVRPAGAYTTRYADLLRARPPRPSAGE